MLLQNIVDPVFLLVVREVSRIDFVHEKRHMDVGGGGGGG